MKKLSLLLLSYIFLVSCASQPVDPGQAQAAETVRTAKLKASPSTWNAAPAEQFASFGKFELKDVMLAPELQSDNRKVQVSATAGSVISDRVQLVLTQWEQKNTGNRTLLITPILTQFQLVSKGARFWAGAFAGHSSVRLEVNFSDKASGDVIATPFFFQGANAYASAWTLGSHDQSIPERLAILFEKYLSDNYEALEGGPTGKDK